MRDNKYINIKTSTTNTRYGSQVIVKVSDLILTWEIIDNAFGDKLPIIPMDSRVKNKKVLYRLKIKAKITHRDTNKPASGICVRFRSNRPDDKLATSSTKTDEEGVVTVNLESRKQGELKIAVASDNITTSPLAVTLKEAWYETGFQITHYFACVEADFSGSLSRAQGLSGQHRADFLFGARGVPMQGTGKTIDGRYVRYIGGGNGWHRNRRGHPDYLNDSQTARFEYTDGVYGRYEKLSADVSIAVDPKIIPPRSKVHIQSKDGKRIVGNRIAHDTGGAIHGAHIDNYSGEGSSVSASWESAGGDLRDAKVKFLGY